MITQKIEANHKPIDKAFLVHLNHPNITPNPVGEYLTLGRSPECHLSLADPFTSHRHARIEKRLNGYYICDLQSRNSTMVNGVQVTQAKLNPGDRIQIGQREFLFVDQSNISPDDKSLKSKNPPWSQQLLSLPSYASTELPVLLLGASGTGKEVLAQLIHRHSGRQHKPFVSVNCSALNESLVESELFGHTKGSFTGASHDRKGAFEAARGGTLFLDEVGDLPLTLQPKLLRALENKEIRPVGSDKIISTDVRIIAATHKTLIQKVHTGQFRTDLFYRLHVIKIEIPNLAERPEDFEDLIYSFGKEMRVAFSLGAIHKLKQYKWPGNIRELKNAVARASALFPNTRIQPEHVDRLIDAFEFDFPIVSPASNKIAESFSKIKELEKEMILERLKANRGNQRQTATELQMPKSTLHDRIKSYGINVKELIKLSAYK